MLKLIKVFAFDEATPRRSTILTEGRDGRGPTLAGLISSPGWLGQVGGFPLLKSLNNNFYHVVEFEIVSIKVWDLGKNL